MFLLFFFLGSKILSPLSSFSWVFNTSSRTFLFLSLSLLHHFGWIHHLVFHSHLFHGWWLWEDYGMRETAWRRELRSTQQSENWRWRLKESQNRNNMGMRCFLFSFLVLADWLFSSSTSRDTQLIMEYKRNANTVICMWNFWLFLPFFLDVDKFSAY